MQACLWAGITLQRHLNRRGGAIKHVQVCFCASTDRESSFHHCGDSVKLVQAFLYAENSLQRRFNRRGGAVKHLHACLRWRKEFSLRSMSCNAGASLFMCEKYPTTLF